MSEVQLRCACGSVQGVAEIVPRLTSRLVCMCDDCQTYAHWLDPAGSILDANGGTEVVQTTPSAVRITAGREHLRCVRLSPKGLMRWYAGCCRTPMANTLESARTPFLGLARVFIVDPSDATLGPIRARIQARYGHPPLAPNSHARAPVGLILRSIRLLLRGYVTGAHRPSPLRDDAGRPFVEPQVLALAERNAARAGVVAKLG